MSKARLDELIEEAVIDGNGESEQATGLYTMLEMIFGCHSKRRSSA